VPTSRPRYQVTETPDVAHALDIAARQWPGEPRSKLLLRLLRAGSAAVEQERTDAAERRLRAINRTSGKYADAFREGYLRELRHDWPA